MNTTKIIGLGVCIAAAVYVCAPVLAAQAVDSLDPVTDNAVGTYDAKDAAKAPTMPLKIGKATAAAAVPVGPLANALSHLGPDKGLSRGIHDTQIYRSASPAVVLVVTEEGLGSGSLIDADGLILTNLHVIAGADKIAVLFKPKQDGAKLGPGDAVPATVVRINATKDLALIKVDHAPDGVTPIKLGKLDDVAVGADVHAIGHPIGEIWSYTKGIVSQIRPDYNWSASDKIKHTATVIQTQTPISPGNSGGPLLDDDGALIGVNSFNTQNAENLNFAVSVADVQGLLAQTADVLPPVSQPPAAAPAKAVDCKEPQVIFQGPNKEKTADLVIFDSTCSGHANGELITPRDMKRSQSLAYFEGDYTKRTVMYFDSKHTATWERSFWRRTPTDTWQLICFHENGNIKPSRCEDYDAYTERMKQQSSAKR